MYYGSVAMHFGWPLTESDDLQSLYYVLLTLADVRLPWLDYTSDREVVMHKLRFQEVEVNLENKNFRSNFKFQCILYFVLSSFLTGSNKPSQISGSNRTICQILYRNERIEH